MSKELDISPDGFLNMLASQNGGGVVQELNREMSKGLQNILDFGGSSTITLKIKISKVKNLDAAMEITPSVTAVHPREKPVSRAMFLTSGNGLSDQQQDQVSMVLDTPVQPVRTIINPIV